MGHAKKCSGHVTLGGTHNIKQFEKDCLEELGLDLAWECGEER